MKRPFKPSAGGLAAALCVTLLLLITLSLVAVACGGSSTETTATTTSSISTTPGGGGSTVQVVMLNTSFDPETLNIKVGDTVTLSGRVVSCEGDRITCEVEARNLAGELLLTAETEVVN